MKKGIIALVLVVIVLLGGGIYFFQTKTISTMPDSLKKSDEVSATNPERKEYINSKYNYKFVYTEPPFSVFKCVSSTEGTKLQKSDGTEDFVILYAPNQGTTSTLPACNQSNEWYKVNGYQASILAISESEVSWKQRVTEFQKTSPTTMESPESSASLAQYRKVTRIGIHTTLLRGENVQVADTDAQVISRHNNITYIIKFDAFGRSAVLGLLDTLKFDK